MAKDSRKLSNEQRDLLVRIVLEKYEKDPQALRRAVPEVTRILEELLGGRKEASTGVLEITEKEALDRQTAYLKIARDAEIGGKRVSRDAAIRALEDVAALREGPFRASLELQSSTVLKLVKVATGLSLEKKGGVRRFVVREGAVSRVVSIVKGVEAHLTWDKRLLAIEIEPKGLTARAKALSFVGIGRDTLTDVARRHDEYFDGAGRA